jgi:hypothetical protein
MSTTCKSTLATGEPCNAPAINKCFSCRHHDPSHPHKTAQPRRRESEPLELPPLVDKCGILSAVVEVVRAVSERRMKRSEGGTLLFGLQLAGSLMNQIDEEGAYPGDFAEPIEPASEAALPSQSTQRTGPSASIQKSPGIPGIDFYRPTPQDDAEFLAIFETGNMEELVKQIAAKRDAWEEQRATGSLAR